jgi:hypothetical protein
VSASGVSSEQGSVGEPLLVFVHIRKTAGTTVRRIIKRQNKRRSTRMVPNYFVEPDRSLETARVLATTTPRGVRAVHGHMLFWPDLPWPAGTRFFTFLRDPVERTISHYCWLRERSRKFTASLDQALVEGLIHDNLQTRVLAASMPSVATEETLERAVANLDRLSAIGLTERFDESVVLMTRAFGWQPMAYRSENVTAGRPPQRDFPPDALATVARYNALDLELYRRVRERFEREVAAQGEDFSLDVASLRRANQLIAEAPDDAKLDRLLPRATDTAGVAGDSADPREQLVDARVTLLLRDAEAERLRAGASRAAAGSVSKGRPRPDTREAALEAAAERAKRRIEKTTQKLQALEEAGAAPDSAELDGLRQDIARAEERLRGFERQRAKLGPRGSPPVKQRG